MVQVKYGEWMEQGFQLFRQNFVLLSLASLIALIIGAASAGILAGPMAAGLVWIALRLLDEPGIKRDISNVFRGFDYFLDSMLFFLIWGSITAVVCFVVSFFPCIGPLAAFFVVYTAQALLMFGLFLIVDKGMGFKEASSESYRRVSENFWHFLSFSAITGLIGSLGMLLCFIGLALSIPIQACMLTAAYRDIYGGKQRKELGLADQ